MRLHCQACNQLTEVVLTKRDGTPICTECMRDPQVTTQIATILRTSGHYFRDSSGRVEELHYKKDKKRKLPKKTVKTKKN